MNSNNFGRNQPIVPKTTGDNTAINFSRKPIPILDVFPIYMSPPAIYLKIADLRFIEYFVIVLKF